jgi:hypothetical protein
LEFPLVNEPRVPHTPGFPVGLAGIAELHAAFLKESRVQFVERTRPNRKSGVWDTDGPSVRENPQVRFFLTFCGTRRVS